MTPGTHPPGLGDQRYQIVKILGQGSSADVYLARHIALNDLRVLKILHQEMMPDSKRRSKFLREAKLAANLKHPAIVKILDVTQTASSLQIEMEYIDGLSLRQHLEQRGRFPLPVALAIVYAVLEGLELAHSSRLAFDDGVVYDGVIHRDLKPENIMLRKQGQPVICDFGVAKLGADLLTMTQSVSGSVAYMAPERLRGDLSTRAIDIFALGVIFFELLTGYRPFRGENKTQVIENILKWNISNVSADLVGMDPSLVEAIQKALSRDPRQRYSDAGQMREALRPVYKLYHGETEPAQVIGEFLRLGRISTAEFRALLPEESPWRRQLAWITLPILVLGLTGAAFYFLDRHAQLGAGAREDFSSLLAEGKLDAAEKILPADPLRRQEACFALAEAYWKTRNSAQALFWADRALNLGYHPRVALLRAEVYLEEGMRDLAREDLDRIKPTLSGMSLETQTDYHWLRIHWLRSAPKPLSTADQKDLRQSLQAILKLVGHPGDPRRESAQAWLTEIH